MSQQSTLYSCECYNNRDNADLSFDCIGKYAPNIENAVPSPYSLISSDKSDPIMSA